MSLPTEIQVDEWVWGKERILWGSDPSHAFTFKMLEPKVGREGCLSLQYHHEKSELWFCLKGLAWALVITDGKVCTRLLRPGEMLQLQQGVIHRLMSAEEGTQVLEPSTPDRHAADKSAPKDVVRLHCFLGRECDAPTEEQAPLVEEAITVSEQAIAALENGKLPEEVNKDFLVSRGFHTVVPM